MFSNRIANSAKFLQMPAESQLLYFHMILRADDDGIVEAYPIIRLLGSSPDSLRVLLAKDFIRQLNEDQVIVITDWHEHNIIRADRKVDSIYLHLLKDRCPEIPYIEPKPRSDVKNNSKRTGGQSTDGISQVKLSKDKLSKVKLIKDYTDSAIDSFNIFWDIYDKKVNPKVCKALWSKIDPSLYQTIFNHARKYIENTPDKHWRKDPERYLKHEMWTSEIISTIKDNKPSIQSELKRFEEMEKEL